ncbi:hypothetical protein E4U47_003596 [Claviceps purpurea]|nr:hypothetical protein E4U47_003596 [Claviceps purpurea]
MKFSILLTSLLSLAVSALPEPDESITVEGNTFTGGDLPKGELKNILTLRGLEKRCHCHPRPCKPLEGHCTPGHCNCGGDNGCYSCNGRPYRCQPGPSAPNVCL